jgi:heat shock 70kDa protein 4
LQVAQDWLYTEEGEDAIKSAYVDRLSALKVLGDPITTRYRESEERPKATSRLRELIGEYMTQATSGDERYAHIDDKDKQSVVEKCATAQKWLEDQMARQLEKPKNADPVLMVADIVKRQDEVIYFASPIMNKPKPKPPVTPGTGTPKPQSRTDTPDPAAAASNGGGGGGAENAKPEDAVPGPSEMDVD